MAARRIGGPKDFYISTDKYLDLTRSYPSAPPSPSIVLETRSVNLLLDVSKTALVIIDMQNFFLSPAIGRKPGPGHHALEQLATKAMPAARKAGMQVIWLNWGMTDEDIDAAPAAMIRSFGHPGTSVDLPAGLVEAGERPARSGGVVKDKRIYKGIGSNMGTAVVNGRDIPAGRVLMRDQWNSALCPPLDRLYDEGRQLPHKPDVWIHKNRMSGMWGASTACEEFLKRQGIRTLLFAGVNTDQCVSGTLTDSYNKGYDCILLADGCGTTSGDFARECIEHNVNNAWGFLSDCACLAESVDSV